MYTCSSVIRSCFPPSSWPRADDERSAFQLLTLSSSPTKRLPLLGKLLRLFSHPRHFPPFTPSPLPFRKFLPNFSTFLKRNGKNLRKYHPSSTSISSYLKFPVFPPVLARSSQFETRKTVFLPKLETRAPFFFLSLREGNKSENGTLVVGSWILGREEILREFRKGSSKWRRRRRRRRRVEKRSNDK